MSFKFSYFAAAAVLSSACVNVSTQARPAHLMGVGPVERTEIVSAIEQHGQVNTAEDVVRYLRPSFVKSRGPSYGDGEQVVVDNHVLGGLSWLSTIPAASIVSMTYLNSADACLRFGAHFTQGAIIIETAP